MTHQFRVGDRVQKVSEYGEFTTREVKLGDMMTVLWQQPRQGHLDHAIVLTDKPMRRAMPLSDTYLRKILPYLHQGFDDRLVCVTTIRYKGIRVNPEKLT